MSSRPPIKRSLLAQCFCVITTIVATTFGSLGQTPKQTSPTQQRKIVSGDFTGNRAPAPAAHQSGRTSAVKPAEGKQSKTKASDTSRQASSKRPKPATEKQTAQAKQPNAGDTYRLASAKPVKPAPKGQAAKSRRAVAAQLGITMWRLRPMTEKDKGATMMVEENGTKSRWVAERVEADTVFNKGDFVRLSIESPRAGYLYVVNQEQYADGTTGSPTVIYPWSGMSRGENHVRPGWIIDIPSLEDSPSYYRATPSQANQLGELLTIVVTKRPLDLPKSKEPLRLTKKQFAEWQRIWKSESDRFEMEGGAGRLWTDEERQAASRIRKRELTRTDPAPQTIYHVAASNTTGYFINVRLAYAR